MQSFLDYVIYSNVLVGLCAFALSYYYSDFTSLVYPSFIGGSTMALYSLHRYISFLVVDKDSSSERILWLRNHSQILIAGIVLGIVIAAVFIYFLPLLVILRVCLVIPIGVMYTIPVVRHHRIRDLPYIKILLVSFLWTYLCVYIPRYIMDVSLSADHWIETIFFFVAITLPFDIRDIGIDRGRYVQTFATLLNEEKTMLLAKILVGISLVIQIATSQEIPLIIMYVYVLAFLQFYPKEKGEYFSSLWMETSMLVPCLVSLVL